MQMFNQASDFVVPIVRNLHYVHLCNEFFTGILEFANY